MCDVEIKSEPKEKTGEAKNEETKKNDWGRTGVRVYRSRYMNYQNDLPPAKKMRYEHDDRRMRYPPDPGYNSYCPWGPETQSSQPLHSRGGGDMETQPPIMTFKAFLQTQDDNITDEEAVAKYGEYKLEFRRQQLNEFFVAHKDEEWFKLKYHPEISVERKKELIASLKKRALVYLEMLESGRVDNVKVDGEDGDAIVKLLDAIVIRLEGGTDLDLTILDQVPPPPASNDKSAVNSEAKNGTAKETNKDEVTEILDDSETGREDEEEGKEEKKKKKEEKKEGEENGEAVTEDADDKGEEAMDIEEDSKEEPKIIEEESDDDEEEKESSKLKDYEDDDRPPGVDTDSEKEEENKEEKDEKKEEEAKEEDANDQSEKKEEEPKKSEEAEKDQSDEVVPLTPRALHKTSSIFLRTISPRMTKAEIENICKKYPGFLRVSLSEPQPEQHWFRRGWVTFRRDVNIKDICWNINNIREVELGAIVNRDLSRRVRTVSGLSAHKQIVLQDLKLCAKLIHELDSRYGLWDDKKSQTTEDNDGEASREEQPKNKEESFGLVSANPLLKGITDFLVEEASAEEEELLGPLAETDDSKSRASASLKVLDRLLLYLRIVFSIDYYNQTQYSSEDEMPNRCGIMHLRGTPSNNEVSEQELNDYFESYKNKLESLVGIGASAVPPITDAEMVCLGAKSQDTEVEKFIQANTQELAVDKWLCPLSGKKFKGPEFVKKHIFNKFSNHLEEVKKEVEYFNNYLRDPKRPQLAEHPGSRGGKRDPAIDNSYDHYRGGRGGFGHFGSHGSFPRGRSFPRGGRSMDYRPVITYRDLDAPCEPDEVI